MNNKECARCKEFKNTDCFWNDKRHKDKLYPYCKDCGKEVQKIRRNKREGVILKKCNKCKKEKTLNFFGKDKKRKDGFTLSCKDCTNMIGRMRRVLNPESWEKQKDKNFINYRNLKGIALNIPRKRHSRPEGSIDRNGYVQIRGNKWKGHPCADKRGRIFEHRLVMYNYIGRPFKENETVHHKNGIRHDNTLENLELWSTSHPYGQRVEDKIHWAKEFLESYGFKVEGTL